MRKYADLLDTALAAAALAGALQLSPWLNRALEPTHEAASSPALHASDIDRSDACDHHGAAAAHSVCAAMQGGRGNGVVTAGADKIF